VAPTSIADGMMSCTSRLLAPSGSLFIYGPFKIDGEYTTLSNQDFDQALNSAGISEWGLKDVSDIARAAEANGLKLEEEFSMPVNNFILKYIRT
jgi:hypothetical protein